MSAICCTYSKYFSHNKPLRHPAQHLLWATVGLAVMHFGFGFPLSVVGILVFISFTYLPDIDGLTAVYLSRNKHGFAKEMIHSLLKFKILKTLSLGAIHHKKLNRLAVHNVVGLAFFIALFIFSLTSNNNLATWALGAVLIHLIFDMIDDIHHIGHINNWLWPIMWIKNR